MGNKIKPNKKKSERIAKKITPIFGLIQTLTEEEIEYLRLTRNQIEKEQSSLRAVGGIMVNLDKADAKIALGKQATARIDGIIKIWNAVKNTPKIKIDYTKKQIQQNKIDRMFNL